MNIQNKSIRSEHSCGHSRSVDLRRLRSQGVLSEREVKWCQTNGVEVAYDPIQIGWVPLECEDDILGTFERPNPRPFHFRAWDLKDSAVYAAMLSSERLWRYLPEVYPGPISADDAAQLIELGYENHHQVLAIEKDGHAIGQVRMLEKGSGSAEVSYWLGETHWGKGYASSIVAQYCDEYLRQRPNVYRVIAVVHTDNLASQAVLRKCAFTDSARDGEWLTLERLRRAS